MRTQMVEATTDQRNGNMSGMVHGSEELVGSVNKTNRHMPPAVVAAFLSRPTWITTGVYEQPKTGNVPVAATEEYIAQRLDHPDDKTLRFATAVLALEMALAGFRGDQRIYPRR